MMTRRRIFSILIALVLLHAVATQPSNVDEKSNQTGTITQFLKSQLALASSKVKQQPQLSGESEKSNANFDSKYKLLLSGDFPSALDLMNDSAEIDGPIEERDTLLSDDDDFFKLKFPEKDTKLSGLKFDRKSENQNIYKVPKTRTGGKKFIPSSFANSTVNERPNYFKYFTHLYDHFTWNVDALNSSSLSKNCREDVQLYLNELDNEADWAVRSSDASGRFRGSFFFDNDFWIGSKDLCSEVNIDNVKNRRIPRMQFYIVKLLVKFEKMKSERLLLVGQCLPDTCSVHDVSQMMSYDPASISFKQKNNLVIVETRKVPGDVNILHNPKFYVFW